eukprot:3435288-Prymnesium_polylepis.3
MTATAAVRLLTGCCPSGLPRWYHPPASDVRLSGCCYVLDWRLSGAVIAVKHYHRIMVHKRPPWHSHHELNTSQVTRRTLPRSLLRLGEIFPGSQGRFPFSISPVTGANGLFIS